MKVKLLDKCCIVTKEKTDKKIYGTFEARGESRLLHLIKKELIKQGHDVIKKRMCKDGNLVDEYQQYIITRKRKEPSFCIYNPYFAIRGANEDFNKGEVVLTVVRDLWK